jgi:hypothetical protein
MNSAKAAALNLLKEHEMMYQDLQTLIHHIFELEDPGWDSYLSLLCSDSSRNISLRKATIQPIRAEFGQG